MSRALLVDCDVVVKEIHNLSRRLNFRLAVQRDITFKSFNDGEKLDSLITPKDVQFEFCFREDNYDVYTRNTKIIPYFRYREWNGSTGQAIKLDVNAREVIETVLAKRLKWMMSLFNGRKVSDGEINTAVEVMASEIIKEICI